jgi:hypothetical protein
MVVGTPDHYLKFVQANLDYPVDTKLRRSLLLFTQYEARINEQAVQTWLSPSLNGPGNVSFTTQWGLNYIFPSEVGRSFIVYPADGSSSFTVPSFTAGTELLGVSRKTISTVINYRDTFVNCPGIGISCRFSEPDMPILEGNPYPNVYNLPIIEGFDFSTFPMGRVYALTEDFNIHADFPNSRAAAKAFNLGDYYNVSRYINNKFIVCVVSGVTLKLLFAQNPLSKGRTKPVSCLDITTNTTTFFTSVNKCTVGLGKPVSFSSGLISTYIKTGKLFQNKFLIKYIT